jgi:hypothetical protein
MSSVLLIVDHSDPPQAQLEKTLHFKTAIIQLKRTKSPLLDTPRRTRDFLISAVQFSQLGENSRETSL